MYQFYPIDAATWPRAETFYYYTQIAPTTYSLTVRMDVTVLRNALKQRGYRFFPAYLYLVTKAINKQQELRIGIRDGVLGYWDTLTPAYPQFHDDDKTIFRGIAKYDESPKRMVIREQKNTVYRLNHKADTVFDFLKEKVSAIKKVVQPIIVQQI